MFLFPLFPGIIIVLFFHFFLLRAFLLHVPIFILFIFLLTLRFFILDANIPQFLDQFLFIVEVLHKFIPILNQKIQNCFIFERGLQSLVFSNKANSKQSIPFQVVDIRSRIFRLNSNNRTLNFRRRFKIIPSNFYQVVYT